jgi:ELWxxDGT repeat protein
MVKDLNLAPQSSSPDSFVEAGGKMFFVAYDPAHGRELWATDGTAAGTALVKDLVPGPSGSNIQGIVALGNDVYFSAVDAAGNGGLWRSDGTAAGTAEITDLPTTFYGGLMSIDGGLYFDGFDGSGNLQLFRSDGTGAGTVQLTDVAGGISNQTITMADLGGTVYFVTEYVQGVGQLWKTDGTPGGTSVVRSLALGAEDLVNAGGTLYFVGNDGGGTQLWKSDGTTAGTSLVKTIYTGPGGLTAFDLTNFNGALYFSADDGVNGRQIWKSDGTEAGTGIVKLITQEGQFLSAGALTVAGDTLYFLDDLPSSSSLWKTDGTDAGTVTVGGASGVNDLVGVGDTLYFTTDSGLWSTDGTDAGTVQLRAAGPVFAFPDPSADPPTESPGQIEEADNLTPFDGGVIFSGPDPATGEELWHSDGTAAGTTLVKDIDAGTQSTIFNGVVAGPGGEVVFQTFAPRTPFSLQRGGTYTLWASDGTDAGTTALTTFGRFPGAILGSTAVVGGDLYFTALDPDGSAAALWVTDGTAAGTRLVKDGFDPLPPYVYSLTASGGLLYFVANDGVNGYELWRSDGTADGTFMVKDINPGGDASPAGLTDVNGTLYFTADDGTDGQQLWKTDGTEAGTTMVTVINPGGSGIHDLTAVSSTLYFGANDGSNGDQLWKSDGTAAGTSLVAVINPFGDAAPQDLVNVGGELYFTADDGTNGRQLWKSDGTAAGTSLVAVINPFGDSDAHQLTAVGGRLFFIASDGTDPDEIWTSDGTAAGTAMLTDPSITVVGTDLIDTIGLPYNFSGGLVGVGGTAYFAAFDPARGLGLWASDGTAAGTRQVHLFSQPFVNSDGSFDTFVPELAPANLTAVNGALYFTASDLVHGTELWKVVPPEASLSGPADGVPYQQRTYTLGASEPAADPSAVYTFAVDWGDGTTDTFAGPAGTAAAHAFPAPGTYTVTLRATDSGGIAGAPVTESVTITQAEVQGGTLAVGGTAGGDLFTVTPGAAAGSVDVTLNGTDLGTFTPAGGAVVIYGGPGSAALTVYGTAGADAFTLGAGTVTVNGLAVSFNSVRTVSVNGLAGNDTFTVADPSAVVNVIGGGDSDTLVGPDRGATWSVTSANAGQVGGVAFTGIQNLKGGSGNDTFAFADGASVAGTVDGGGGVNTLDYSAYTTGVTVNLLLGTATGTAGVLNVANVTGGSGNDLLVGDWHANVLRGGAGRDVLIGGFGGDTLDGGSGEDIVIGGWTPYDANAPALAAVAAYWGRTDLSFAARTAGLASGVTYQSGGTTHTARLTTGTVFNDFASDTLTGGGDADWFFAYLGSGATDVITDLTPADKLTRLPLI